MFGTLKMLFKNKDQIAQGVWSMIGSPINLARTTGSYKDFANEFISDDYLFGFFNRYINLMITYFFKIKNPTDRGFIIGKIYELFDPRYKDSRELMKIFDLIQFVIRLIIFNAATPRKKKENVPISENGFSSLEN